MGDQQRSSKKENVQRLSHLRVHLNTNHIQVETGDTHSIYVLVDPNTLCIRYVGQTIKTSLKERLNEHIQELKRSSYRVCNWIKSLTKQKCKPLILLVAKYSTNNINQAEIEWIKLLRKSCDLTNHLDGGNQGFGYKHSKERRAKISKALKGKKKSKECLLKQRIVQSKIVYQYTIEGDYIQNYQGAKYAEEVNNYSSGSVGAACRRNGTAYGYAWRYEKIDKKNFLISDKRFKTNTKKKIY